MRSIGPLPPSLSTVFPTEESQPSYICIDKACEVLRIVIAHQEWSRFLRSSRLIVDAYHYINHRLLDYLCCRWCNPAPLDGSAPNLVRVAIDDDGNECLQRAFNT